jgi:hypothetical protein
MLYNQTVVTVLVLTATKWNMTTHAGAMTKWKDSVLLYNLFIFSLLNAAVRVGFFFSPNLCCGILGTAATTGLLYQPRMIGDGDCGEIGGMKIGKGKRSTRRKPAPAPLCPPHIPYD